MKVVIQIPVTIEMDVDVFPRQRRRSALTSIRAATKRALSDFDHALYHGTVMSRLWFGEAVVVDGPSEAIRSRMKDLTLPSVADGSGGSDGEG